MITSLEPPALRAEEDAVLDAIRSRRSVGKVGPERPPRETIERVLEAATWAPNHHLTQPWRFVVLAGEARRRLGETIARATLGEPTTEEERAAFERAAAKPLRAPVVIAVAVEPAGSGKIPEIEEVAAGAAAVQNLLLAAHALGLAAIWRTGGGCYQAAVKEHLGFGPASHLIGLVYLGYPVADPPVRERIPADSLTVWRGWNDATATETRG